VKKIWPETNHLLFTPVPRLYNLCLMLAKDYLAREN